MSLFRVQTLFALLLLNAGTAAADVFRIEDREGFETAYIAKAVAVPAGWTSSGRIAWIKPCSSSDLFETIFTTHSPDGRAGARIMPGYQFLHNSAWLTPGYARDPIIDMMLAETQASNRQLETQFRGSNCGTRRLQGSDAILQALVLPARPADARVLRVETDQATRGALSQSFGGGLPGITIGFDAQIVDLGYRHNGAEIVERIYLSWYSFDQQPIDLGGVTVGTTHTIVEPLRLIWAPRDQAADLLPRLETVFASMKTNPEWQKRVDAVFKALAEQRDQDRARREAESDRRHKEFIEMITEGGASPSTEPATPSASASTPETGAETDFWGEPKKETDFWGEPKPETDYWGEPIKTDP